MNLISLLNFITFLFACGSARRLEAFSRIIDGIEAEKGQFPHQVSVKLSLTHKHICGGSIVSDKFILTAGHCFERDDKPTDIFVYFGALDIINDGIVMNLEKIIIHPSFDIRKLTNDITILKTIGTIIFSDFVKPISLPTQNVLADGQMDVTVTGWGRSTVSLSFPKFSFCIYILKKTEMFEF